MSVPPRRRSTVAGTLFLLRERIQAARKGRCGVVTLLIYTTVMTRQTDQRGRGAPQRPRPAFIVEGNAMRSPEREL